MPMCPCSEDDGEAEVAINVKVAKPAASTPFVPASSVFRPASATIGSGKVCSLLRGSLSLSWFGLLG